MTTEPKPTIDELVRTEYAWTARQREVLDFIARGRSNPEIAEALGISLDGAKWHMREILSKLGVESREEAAEYWRRRNGWHSRLSRVFRGLHWLTGARLAGAGLAAAAVVAAVGAVGIFLAFGSDRPSTGTAGPPSQVSPSATAQPELGGIDAVVSQTVAAVSTNDWPGLLTLLTATEIPCSSGDLNPLLRCGPVAEGTPVAAVLRFQCGRAWVSLSDLRDESSSTPLAGQFRIHGVVAGGPPIDAGGYSQPVEGWALFLDDQPGDPRALAVALGADGVLGFGTSCGAVADFVNSYVAAGTGWLVPPAP